MIPLLLLWNLAASGLWYVLLSRRIRYVVDKQDPTVLFLAFGVGLLSVVATFLIHFMYPLS